MMKTVACMIILFLCAFQPASGQEIEDFIDRYLGNDAEAYLRPLADAAGSDFNSGWYRSARIDRKGFRLYFGLVAQSAPVADKNKTFTATTPDYFNPQSTAEVSTILGSPRSTQIEGANGTSYTFPGGAGVSSLPFAIPQLTIGNLFGTDFTFRFFAIDVGGDVGDVNVFGWGVRHSISQYLPDFPVHLAAGYFSTNFDLGDNLEANASLISLQASYRTGVLEIYGGPGYEMVDMDFSYVPGGEEQETTISVSGENSIRMTVGAALNLGAFVLNADFNLARQSSFSAGIGLQFGNNNDENNEASN